MIRLFSIKAPRIFAASASAILFFAFIYFYLAPAFAGQRAVVADYYIGTLRIHLYSWLFLVAVLVAYWLVRRLAAARNLAVTKIENIFLAAFVGGFVGARVHHVISLWSFYFSNPLKIFMPWQGGLGIYGGILGGILAVIFMCRHYRLNFFEIADIFAPALALGQAIGRWGNFFNQEVFGYPTNLPWKMFVDRLHRPPGLADVNFFHPWFLYESLWNLVTFGVLIVLSRRLSKPTAASGKIFGWYLLIYACGRFILEPLRADPTVYHGLLINQIFSLLAAAAGAAILWNPRRLERLRQRL